MANEGAWPNHPLVYVLAMARFPIIEDLADFIPAFGKAVADRFPDMTSHTNQVATAQFGPEGLRLDSQQETLWQFLSSDRHRAVLVGRNFAILHCDKAGYSDHDSFSAELGNNIQLLSCVPGINLTHITSLGYRYVDLILPNPGETPAEYLQAWALPADIPADVTVGMDVLEGTSVWAFKTSTGLLRFQAHRRPPATLPGDLDSPFMRQNGWVADLPDRDFVLLDIDQGRQFETAVEWRVEDFRTQMIEVCQPGRKLFRESVTAFARAVWEEQK